jgi:predicted TIM-barrel fold metal-dependent hydrolase
LQLVTTAQVLFGTDFPPAAPASTSRRRCRLRMFSESDLRAIDRDNAVRLLPRLGSASA